MGYTVADDGEPQFNNDASNGGAGPVHDIAGAVAWASRIGGLLKGSRSERTSLTARQVRLGWVFVETDTQQVFLCTSVSPLEFQYLGGGSTGWVPVAPAANWSVGTRATYRGLSVRRFGKQVFLEGAATWNGSGPTGAGLVAAVVPAGFRPAVRAPLVYRDAEYSVFPNGNIEAGAGIPSGGVSILSGMWVLD